MTNDERVAKTIDAVRAALAGYVFRVRNEAELQRMVFHVIERCAGTKTSDDQWLLPSAMIKREVRVRGSRFDLLVQAHHVRVVFELKMRAGAAAVERQAQRYAAFPDVDAVVVVTTSLRLARQLEDGGGPTLGGKPFRAIAVRTS